ncbi:MAG: N-acetylmuramoyl-L-alanine amidase [bacterium]|nr:N-acetylmuramoyl-L-alanine amidase [bacterium]
MNRAFRIIVTKLFLAACLISPIFSAPVHAADRLQELPERPVIVIDPGHGGDNRGTIEGNQDEKYMTMTTALAMYQELCQYDGVDVYLTRTDDETVRIEDRAIFAESVNADFLFSIHYNASENHELFGSEIWVSHEAPYNNYGYQFGQVFLSAMREQGLFLRGIKTRLNDRGTDYYGIIRESVARGVPAVILEHCHVDEARDGGYCDSEEDLIRFGKEDATAVAKYFGLKSSSLRVDYSDYALAWADRGSAVASTLRDDTPPDVCLLEFAGADYEAGMLNLTVSAADYDTPLLYYSYSLDGGISYSERFAWPGSDALSGGYDDTFLLSLPIPDGTTPFVVLRAYNLYDLYTESNPYDSPRMFLYPKEEASNPLPEEAASGNVDVPSEGEDMPEASLPALTDSVQAEHPVSILTFLEICLAVMIILFVILLISQAIAYRNRRRRRRQRRKDAGERRNQQR